MEQVFLTLNFIFNKKPLTPLELRGQNFFTMSIGHLTFEERKAMFDFCYSYAKDWIESNNLNDPYDDYKQDEKGEDETAWEHTKAGYIFTDIREDCIDVMLESCKFFEEEIREFWDEDDDFQTQVRELIMSNFKF